MTKPSFSGGEGSWWKAWGLRIGFLLIAAAVVLLATTSTKGQDSSLSSGEQAASQDASEANQPKPDAAEISLPSFNSNNEDDQNDQNDQNDTEAAQGSSSTDEPAESGPDKFEPFTDLPQISVADLPPEAWETLDLIYQSGPYPFSKDDSVFQNREGILPSHPRGHYREYTVITPGADNRGARRIVAGEAGELFYTDDHYDSFSEIGFS